VFLAHVETEYSRTVVIPRHKFVTELPGRLAQGFIHTHHLQEFEAAAESLCGDWGQC
jgi:hypothetical protein